MTDGAAPSPGATPRPPPQALLQEHDGWLYFAAISGARGRTWAEEFRRPECFGVLTTAGRALPLLHRRDFDGGRRLLEEAESGLRALRGARPSFLFVLESIYHPLLAYYHYCLGDLAPARQDLDRGEAGVAAAIELEPFLLPLAFRCAEFALHRARLCRNQRRWDEMRRHIDQALAMIGGNRAFCTLPGGGEVTLPQVQSFFRGLPPIDPEMERFSRQLTDDRTRHHLFDLFVLGIYAIPGLVISYP